MQDLVFDHVFSACKDNNLKNTLEDFRNAGFTIDPDVTKHGFGNYSGFVLFTGTYLEFLEFYDRSLWNPNQDADTEVSVNSFRPYGMGMRCADSQALYDSLAKDYANIEPAYEAGRKDGPDLSPIWRFFSFPKRSLPGASSFSVQYLRYPTDRSKIQKRINPNGVFGIRGYTFCVNSPERSVTQWRDTLSKITKTQVTGHRISFGVQEIEWVTPDEYESRFNVKWNKVDSVYGDLAAVKLLTESLETTVESLGSLSNRPDVKLIHQKHCMSPHPNTGFAFELSEGNADQFLDGLMKLKIS